MRTILLALFVCFLHTADATTYYFSALSGDDSRTSTEAKNSSTPWKSLGKLNSFFSSLQPGDAVLLKRGETFYGSIIVNKSGTSGSPIFVGAYGSGDKPVITSLVAPGNWVSKGSGIWESYNSSFGSSVNVVLLNGLQQELGRYPNNNAANKGYLNFESHSGNTSITDKQLSAAPNWTGAELVLRTRRWVINRNPITNHSGTKITYSTSSSYSAIDNYGYFIQNSIKTLDKLGEWYYSASSKKLSVYFGSNSPSSYKVQTAAIDNLVYSNKFSNVVFDNLNIEGANSSAVNIRNGSNIHIQNCDILFSGEDGIQAYYHPYLQVENCNISNSNFNGIDLGYSGDYAEIRNNKIINTSIFSGMGGNGDGQGIAIFSNGNNSIIEYNTITNTGYTGIKFNGDYVTIKNNLIDNFCITKDDGSGIYTYTGSSNATRKGRKVIGNIVINGKAASEGTSNLTAFPAEGIYIDMGASGVEIADNTVANCSNHGIYIQNSHEITIKNNTVFNSNSRQLGMVQKSDHPDIRNCVISNNIFFSKLATQKVLYLSSDANDTRSFGKFTGNYYARPSDNQNSDYLSGVKVYESYPTFINFSNSLRFEYNAQKTAKTVALDASYADVKSNKYSGSITLQPFTSAVLIKSGSGSSDASPDVVITSPAANASFKAGVSIDISADASDDGSISKVEFYEGSTLLDVENIAPYTYTWQNVSAGTYTITAKATDNSGNVTTSAGVSVSVTSATSSDPTVSITSPASNENFIPGAAIDISADASDDESISKVEFYQGTTLLNTQYEAPYAYTWLNVSAGNYTITAKATDNSGNVTTSAEVSVSVSSGTSGNPAVSLTSPAESESYAAGATITISADASDNNGSIDKVEFYNGTTLLHTEVLSPYVWDWKNVGLGNYTLTAKAIDNSGNATTSESVSITVTSSSYPSVSITSPKQSASYKTGSTISISADASDANGSIDKVEFYKGSTLLHTEVLSPYIWDWKNVSSGNYTLTAKATDNSGNVTTSASVSISVSSSGLSARSSNNANQQVTVSSNDTSNAQKAISNKIGDTSFDFSLYPNPAVNTIKINYNDRRSNRKATVSIQNVSGIMLKSTSVILSGKTTEIDISSLRSGTYIISLTTDNFVINKKFIKIN